MKDKLSQEPTLQDRGLLAWFARNHVAANLLMIFVIASGIMALINARVEIFPEVSIDIVRVTVPYRGASPTESEQGVCLRVEEAVASVDGVKRVSSVASEGSGTIVVEVEEYANLQKVLEDVKTEVDRIETFPLETEKPIVVSLDNRTQVVFLAVYGDVAESTLKNLAGDVRDELTAMDGISQVEIQGARDFEISFEVSEETLRRYNLTFDELSATVARSSLDLPGGSIKTAGGEMLFRAKGQKYSGRDFREIIVRTNGDGSILRLGDIARVIDGFEDSDIAARYNGKPAVMLNVFRIGEQNALDISRMVNDYVEEIRGRLPAGVDAKIWYDFTDMLRGRINLLVKNGYIGLALVFLCLMLFLDLRLAFWTTIGIPISFCGAFFLMPMLGVSINMISLFAFIVSLGIVVDDAIVVGENIFDYRQQGMKPIQAAIIGAKEMAGPVTMAILTTVAAFSPLLYVEGVMGKFMRVLPLVVITVLLFSLVEAFLILPAHLSTGKRKEKPGPIAQFQGMIRNGLNWFIQRPFGWLLDRAITYRYVTLAGGLAVFAIIIGLVAGGRLKVVFFPNMEADNMYATLVMPQGTVRSETERVVAYLEQAVERTQQDMLDEGTLKQPIFKEIVTYIGTQPSTTEGGGPHGRGVGGIGGSHLGEVNVMLVESDKRDISAKEVMRRWEENVGQVPGVSTLTFTSELFNVGDAINVELSHRDFDTLIQASDDLKTILADYAGVSQIADTFEPGKLELKLDLTDRGRTLDLTLNDLAKQVRQGFYGEEIQRIQRGRDDVRVMLRYPEEQRKTIDDIESMRIRLPDGTAIPFLEVADVELGRGYATIDRANRRRIVSVKAAVDDNIANAAEINEELADSVLPKLMQSYPGLAFTFQGEQKEQQETNASLGKDFIIALIAIFGLLAVQFRSYLQPLIIMSAIPFGVIGAVIGHLIMGYSLSLLSFFGIVALTGVVVNDSLILVDLINRWRGRQMHLHEIVRESAQRRFRPILLTTLTTFFGLTPMLMETSLQAKFLIPMAISLGFGVLFATVITLFLVPALYMILEDVKIFFAYIFQKRDSLQNPYPVPTRITETAALSEKSSAARDEHSETAGPASLADRRPENIFN